MELMEHNKVGIGIDIGGTSIKYGLVDDCGKVIWHSERPTEGVISSEQVLKNIYAAADDAIHVAKENQIEIDSIGLGTPGLVKGANTIIGGANNISGWENIALGDLMSAHTGILSVVGNDADMMGLGEFKASGCENSDTVLFATLGTGIGGAIFIDGKLFQGHFGLGGEIGMFPMFMDGEMKCWEDVASTSAMLRMYTSLSKTKNEVTGKQVVTEFKEGEPIAIQCIDTMTENVGMGLAGFVNVLNPKRIVIGGGMSQAGDFFIDKIVEAVQKYALADSLKNIQIVAAKLGNKAGLVGASLYGINKVKEHNSLKLV